VRALLQDGPGASHLLSLPGGAARLLRHAGVRPSAPAAAAAAAAEGDELVALLLAAALRPAVASELGQALRAQDAAALVELLAPGQPPAAQHLARAFLRACLEGGGPGGRARLAAAGLNGALAAAAMDEVEGGGDRGVLAQLVQLMRAMLAAEGGQQADVADADVAAFVRPALYIAADAAVEGNVALATSAMQVLAWWVAGPPSPCAALRRAACHLASGRAPAGPCWPLLPLPLPLPLLSCPPHCPPAKAACRTWPRDQGRAPPPRQVRAGGRAADCGRAARLPRRPHAGPRLPGGTAGAEGAGGGHRGGAGAAAGGAPPPLRHPPACIPRVPMLPPPSPLLHPPHTHTLGAAPSPPPPPPPIPGCCRCWTATASGSTGRR
jgi:hypothetical protein